MYTEAADIKELAMKAGLRDRNFDKLQRRMEGLKKEKIAEKES